jgi:autotransporter-associated beta strand protein
MMKSFTNSFVWLVCLLILTTARPAMAQSTSLVRTNTNDSQTIDATATNGSNIPLGNPRTIRWSLVPDGTKIPSAYYAGSDSNRPSRLIVDLDNVFSVPSGSRGADLTTRSWFSSFQNMVNRIANKTGFTFIYEPNDDGREIGASNSDGVIGVRGDLRIGGGPLNGALGYNGVPTGGHLPDMILNTDFAWKSSTLNFIATHELHHGLGFGHVRVNDDGNASAVTGNGGNSNGPQFHDLIQLHRKYGDTFENPVRNDTRANATVLGTLVPGGTLRAGSDWGTGVNIGAGDTNVTTISASTDVDFFRIDTTGPMQVRATLTPRGPTYNYVSEGQTGATVDATKFMNLRFEVQNASGTVIATAASAAAGAVESLTALQLPAAGAWYFRVSMEGSSTSPQAYTMEVTDHPDSDSDGDGATDSQEYAIGRDPADPADLAFGFNTGGDFEGWTSSANVSSKTIAGGLFSGTVSASGPQIWRTGFGFDGSLVPRLVLRIRSSVTGPCEIYWGRIGADSFASPRMSTANVTQANTWQTLVFPLSSHAGWNGQTITRLRVDPPGGTGATFSIDFLVGPNLVWHPGSDPGGAGSWDSATASWRTDNQALAWVPGNRALFRGTGGAITLDAPASVGGLVFATAGYSLGGQALLTLSPDAEIRVATETTTISSPLAATTLAKSGNGTLLLNGSIGTLTGLALNGGTVNLQPTDEAQITGPITGTGALRKSGGWDSLLTLGGANTFTGDATIASGVLRLTRSDSLGIGTKTVTMSNGSDGKCRIILAGGSPGMVLPASISFLASNNGTERPAFLNESGDNTIHGNFTFTTGGGGTRFTSAAGRLTLTGTLSPNTSGRVVHLDGAATGVISGSLRNRSNGDQLALEKTGSGTWTLTGDSTATGATDVLGGLLQITGSLAAPVTVRGGGTLGGTGTVAALTTTSTVAGSGAGLAPGVAGIGKLMVAGDAVIGPQTRYTWELGDANGQPGTAWDLLDASSLQLTATPSQPLEITILPNQVTNLPTSPRAFVIARGIGGITGFDPAAVILDSAAFPPAVGTWSIRQTGNTLELVLTPDGYDSWPQPPVDLLSWDITENTISVGSGIAISVMAGTSGSDLRGGGTQGVADSPTNTWNRTFTTTSDFDAAQEVGNFFRFTTTAAPGFSVRIYGIEGLRLSRTDTGPASAGMFYSTDGGITFTQTGTTFSVGTAQASAADAFASTMSLDPILIGEGTTIHWRLVVSGAGGRLGIGKVTGPDFTLMGASTANHYAAWAIANGTAGQAASDDFDKDGIANLVEYALGLDPTASNGAPGTFISGVLSFSKGPDASANGDVIYQIEQSDDLTWWSSVTPTVDDDDTISFTLSPGETQKFLRLKITLVP